jgi:hypothetical protein
MKTTRLLLITALLYPLAAMAQGPGAVCNQSAIFSTTSTGVQQVISAPGVPQSVRICSVYFQVIQGTAAANFGLVAGTGTNCGTGQANLTGAWTGVASTIQGYTQEPGPSAAIKAPAGKAVCLNLSAAPTAANVQILYAVY